MSTADLGAWFRERPKWLQRAVQKLLDKDHLTDKDIIDLTELCRKDAVSDDGKFEYAFSVEAFTSNASDAVHLCSIGDVQGINALAPRIPLGFGEGNLAIIYGQNGSGKSGYVRILKHICGARYQRTLRSNFYSSESVMQQCSISYEINGSATSCTWQANSGVIDDLCGIDIFDSSCGHVYIANENEVSYEPPVLSFFSSLISACGNVFKLLDDEENRLILQKPVLPSDYANTMLGRWYANLSKDINVNDIVKYCSWTDEDEREMEQLNKRLSEQSPADKTKQFRARKQHADTLIQNTEDLFKKLSDENYRRILDIKKSALLKLNASKTAVEQVFRNAPLEGIGSDVWKLLWEQARKYSQEQAYKEKTFPCVEEDARCVLCQQPLSKDAARRLRSFEGFVKGEMQKEAEAAKKRLDDAMGEVGELPSEAAVETRVDAAGLTNNQDTLKVFYAALRNRKDKLLAKVNSVEEIDAATLEITVLPEYKEWIDKTRGISSGYDESAQKYEEDSKQDNRTELISKRLELQVRKWLFQQDKSVKNEINRLKQVDAIQAAKRLTDTTGLSRKKGDLAEELITEAFIGRFDNELKQLGANRIKIGLVKTRVNKGRVLHRLKLRDAVSGSPEDMLSEGEHKVVSLAAFLADVAEKQNSTPFVFDDPVSSLDQDFEEAVVQRLVELSKTRQVIVFTHRLSLLGLIQNYGEKAGCKPHVVCVRREPWGTGEPGDTPLWAANPKKANNILLDQWVIKARDIYESKGQQAYEVHAQSLCSEFRKLLEKTIEYDLLADVLHRHRREVHTKNTLNKLAKINSADCSFIDDLMTKYSRYEHSHSDESPVSLPAPDDLQSDLEELKNWRDNFYKRVTP